MNLKPLGDRVIIKQDEAAQMTKSGLYLSRDAQEKPQRGVVVAVGDGKLDSNGNLVKPGVSEGDVVMYSKYGGTEIDVDGVEYIILRADDIYGVYQN